MKFKIDENLPIEVVRMLEDNGHDALTVLGKISVANRIHELLKFAKRKSVP